MTIIPLPNIEEGRDRQLKRLRSQLKSELASTCKTLERDSGLADIPQITEAIQILWKISNAIDALDVESPDVIAILQRTAIEIRIFANDLLVILRKQANNDDSSIIDEVLLRR